MSRTWSSIYRRREAGSKSSGRFCASAMAVRTDSGSMVSGRVVVGAPPKNGLCGGVKSSGGCSDILSFVREDF
jgi:hypothetical protein